MGGNLNTIQGGSTNSGAGDTSGNNIAANTAAVLQDVEVINRLLSEGVRFAEEGNFDKAILSFNKVLEIEPNSCEALANIAIAYAKGKKYAEAIVTIDKVITLKPEASISYLYKGNFLCGLENYQEAINLYNKVIDISPAKSKIWIDAMRCKSAALKNMRIIDNALSIIEHAILLAPESADLFFDKGNILCDLGMQEEGILAYQECLKRDWLYIPAMTNLAVTLKELGKLEEAQKWANAAEKWSDMIQSYGESQLRSWGMAFSESKID